MFNLDLAIFVGVLLAGIGMTSVGIEMTIHPPLAESHAKWWYRGSFIVMGLASIGLSIWQFERAATETQRLARREHQAEQIRNEGNIKFVQGQLDTMTKVLGGLSANSNPQVTIAALKGILPSIVSPQSGKSALEKMSNRLLQSRVIEFSNQMRTFVATFEEQTTNGLDREFQERIGVTDEAKNREIWERHRRFEQAVEKQFLLDYKQKFSGTAIAYRDELIRRLGPQPAEVYPKNKPLALDEEWVSPTSVEATALYLEKLARKLPN